MQCRDDATYAIGDDLAVHAYPTKAALAKAIDAQRAVDCARVLLGSRPTQVSYRVGRHWWTFTYRPLVSAKIAAAIDGTLTTYACA